MKNNTFKILIFSFFGIITFSCNNELDFAPYNQKPPVQFFQNADDAQKAVNACYGGLTGWDFFDPSTFGVSEMASGNTVKGGAASDQVVVYQFSNFTSTSTHINIGNNWRGRYNVINFCNQAITNIPNIDMDEATKKSLIAEAKFIRAWLYFDLAKTFGEVVIYDGIPEDGNYNLPKSSFADVYKFIESDLEYTIANGRTAAWDINNKGRVTSWAGLALLAKVKMYEASGANFTDDGQAINGRSWADVKATTDAVISSNFYRLFTDRGDSSFFYLFRLPYENCDESIFEMQNGSVNISYYGTNHSSACQYQWATTLNGWGFNAPSDKLITDWAARTDDTIRFRQSVAFQGLILPDGDIVDPNGVFQAGTGSVAANPNATGNARCRFNFKAYESRLDDKGFGGWQRLIEQNLRLFRYADVILIDAEAEFNLGNLQEAVNSINLVRARVKETPLTTANITLQKIWDERRFELAFENDYFFDLVRTGQAKTVLGPNGFQYPKDNFYPIPQTQIDLSAGVLKQNKNWE
ncbi:RagB/SusD family nutrient uptake outer membrane protein [Prolixibacter sp. SD074]|uniref:RagB/SusD family nutrient uptake outer membrane protein n=1 Tax=Prolixibacter sp. SD074 TaxID=2652391 RepID=UPI001280A8F0|nr:RagB/SusD family nutrient uptake outer membrane protein [Prolixibacter sp. SD074]GET28874.1 membrane protein [Prolixibacter sp. SD074]